MRKMQEPQVLDIKGRMNIRVNGTTYCWMPAIVHVAVNEGPSQRQGWVCEDLPGLVMHYRHRIEITDRWDGRKPATCCIVHSASGLAIFTADTKGGLARRDAATRATLLHLASSAWTQDEPDQVLAHLRKAGLSDGAGYTARTRTILEEGVDPEVQAPEEDTLTLPLGRLPVADARTLLERATSGRPVRVGDYRPAPNLKPRGRERGREGAYWPEALATLRTLDEGALVCVAVDEDLQHRPVLRMGWLMPTTGGQASGTVCMFHCEPVNR